MDLKNLSASVYVPPFGEDLQHVRGVDDTVSLHSDIYLLSHMSEMKLSASSIQALESRLSQLSDSLPDSLRTEFDKLSDWQKIDLADSRYTQFLSDRSSKLKSFIDKYDAQKKKVDDSKKSLELSAFEQGLRDLIKKYEDF